MPIVLIHKAPKNHQFKFVLGDGTNVVGRTGEGGFCRMHLDAPLPSDATLDWESFKTRMENAHSIEGAFAGNGAPPANKREKKLLHAAIGALNKDANWWCLLRDIVSEYPDTAEKIDRRGNGKEHVRELDPESNP